MFFVLLPRQQIIVHFDSFLFLTEFRIGQLVFLQFLPRQLRPVHERVPSLAQRMFRCVSLFRLGSGSLKALLWISLTK